jgi:hypothetical protein
LAANPPKSFVGSLPPFTVAEKRAVRQRAIDMLLPIKKSYELLAKYGCFAREICDKCGIVLGAVRFTRYNASKVYCSRECRGDAQRSATHRRGRPRKYKTDRERRTAMTRQRQVYRSRPNVEKTVRIQSETKNLQTQKVPLSYSGTPGPGKPLISRQRTYMGDRAKTRDAHPSARTVGGASEWAGPRRENGKSQRSSVRFFSLEGLFIYRGSSL